LLKKKLRISQWFLVAVFVYAGFVSILFIRMKIAERMLAEYYEARSCPSTSNCREIVSAMVLEAGPKQVSFINYGPRGVPLRRGTFKEYRFKLAMSGATTRFVRVVPGAPSDSSLFDGAKIYSPAILDEAMVNVQVLQGRSVVVEVWHDRVTLLTIVLPVTQQADLPAQGSTSIGPPGPTQEITLATAKHPLIVAESSRNDVAGWTGGLLLLSLPFLIFGLDWIIGKGRALKEKLK